MAKDEMIVLCAKFAAGKLSHGITDDIMVQLRAEGSRRSYSFVFETLFRRRVERLAKAVPGLVVSFGWHIGYDSSRAPAYWFRLLDAESDWNRCDDQFLSRLSRPGACGSTPVTVLRVMYSETDNAMISSEARAGGWLEWQPLPDALTSLPGKGDACSPRDMDGSRCDDDELVQMLRQLGMAELRSISVQRRFMNCVLGPILGADGTDLDVIALTPSGELNYIEFKRAFRTAPPAKAEVGAFSPAAPGTDSGAGWLPKTGAAAVRRKIFWRAACELPMSRADHGQCAPSQTGRRAACR